MRLGPHRRRAKWAIPASYPVARHAVRRRSMNGAMSAPGRSLRQAQTVKRIMLMSTTTSKPNGFFAFVNLPPGDYLVQVSDRAHVLTAYKRTTPLDPVPVTLTTGDPAGIARFGYAPVLPYCVYLPVAMKE